MTQMTLTLDPEVDEKFLLKVLQNIKGIRSVKISHSDKEDAASPQQKADEMIRKLNEVRNSIDRSLIDMNDERTRYILSK